MKEDERKIPGAAKRCPFHCSPKQEEKREFGCAHVKRTQSQERKKCVFSSDQVGLKNGSL